MTVTTTKNRINQTADGIQTIFIYDFIVLDAAHMFPYLDDVVQTAGFTVNGVGDPAGGDVTFDVAPADGVTVTLARIVPFTQLVDYVPYDPFPAETHEGALDKLTLITQQVEDAIARSLQLPLSTEAGDLTLPEPIAGYLLQWNATNDGLDNVSVASLDDLVVTTPFTESLLDDPDADTFWATLMATITKATARSILGAAGLADANTFSAANIFNAAMTLNALNTFNEKAVFNKVIHQQIGSNIASAATLPNVTDGNYASVTAIAAGITGATQADPVVITAVAHGLSNGDKVMFAGVGGMIEINGIEYTVANVTADTFELSGIDGTAFTAYTSGGSIWASIIELSTTSEVGTIIYRKFNGSLVLTHDATNLILFGGSNIITSLGDVAKFIEYASGDFKLIDYARVSGAPIASPQGSMVQLAEASISTGLILTAATNIPDDDTIPQNNEGSEVMTVAITPKDSSNKLIIEIFISMMDSTIGNPLIVLFQDDIADALAISKVITSSINLSHGGVLRYVMPAGTTDEIIFKCRVGQTSGTIYLNRRSAGELYGAATVSSITVTEVQS